MPRGKISVRQLQKLFAKHGGDFGLSGTWSPARAAEIRAAIDWHLSSPGVKSVRGIYRGMPVVHVVDQTTRLNVILDPLDDRILGGWKLSEEQLASVLEAGRLS